MTTVVTKAVGGTAKPVGVLTSKRTSAPTRIGPALADNGSTRYPRPPQRVLTHERVFWGGAVHIRRWRRPIDELRDG